MQPAAGILLFCALAVPALGQRYEIGADLGYGWYGSGTIFSPVATVKAGVRNRFAAGILFGDEFSPYVSAEFEYLYQDGDPYLEGAGVRANIQGQSHALTYNLLFHFKPRDSRFRPFLSGGVGGKEYVIAGPEPFPQPVPAIASLTTNDVWKVVFTVGGGLKMRLRDHMLLRVGFRDHLTTFPRQQIVPAPHNTARGIAQQISPLAGLSYSW